MPAKTVKGAQEAAKWRAFRHYLKNIEQYSDIRQAAQQFDKFIGYAVALVFRSEVIRRLDSRHDGDAALVLSHLYGRPLASVAIVVIRDVRHVRSAAVCRSDAVCSSMAPAV